ncbi:molybdopterin converting factor, subunit 2 [Acinetobacter sp. WC-323]|uniref:molybdenum cofactor biosynthesis protein MoaE n=1 Tax=Acinetobacter sp. WC-323 TaxID=903918 RepID=UPI00029E6164|nr:molybdenum cofactor biosynthesis protein MoaE [Acinetobacter sp. WC-323]EKU51373.1 molybdopterin converting factor, subunit 2 [Acinetobacter sp. WC-323]
MREFARVQDQALSLDSFDPIHSFPECGGIDIFIGTVRNHHEGKAVKALKYTSYTPVAEKMIREIEQQVKDKYQVSYVRVMHRIGYLEVSETAIIAIAYAAHRREAFQACEEAVERVKHEVPIWKEEFFMDGTSHYVEGCCIRKDTAESTSQAERHQHVHHSENCTHAHTHE